MTSSFYKIPLPVEKGFRAAVAADVHESREYEKIIKMIGDSSPDLILIPGDLCSGAGDYDIPIKFLRMASQIAPVYYTFGNHERWVDENDLKMPGIYILNSKTAKFREVVIGGLRSGFTGQHETCINKTPKPDIEFLDRFERFSAPKLLLCHHPEYYEKYLRSRNIDLIFAGHAHGGQWRFFGRGVFAPGQGIFPKYTSGLIDERMIVSRGLANTVKLPRLFNETELVIADIEPKI